MSNTQDSYDQWLQAIIEIQVGIEDDTVPTDEQLQAIDLIWEEIDKTGQCHFTFASN
jgi:hypothetical protein